MLHDVGKVAIPVEILNKPGKLTTEEFEIVKVHPLRGWEILQSDPNVDDIVRDVCRHHHEKMDGSGYPDKLAGEAVSLYAQMAAVCDVYDALTSDCSYRKAFAPAEAPPVLLLLAHLAPARPGAPTAAMTAPIALVLP